MAKSVQAVANKWVRGVQGSSETAKEGAMSVTVAPGIRAAEQAQLYLQRIQQAVAEGRYQEAVSAVSLASWQTDYINKGIPTMTARAAQAKPKMERFLQFWLPITEEASREVQAMPKGGPEMSKARMLRNFDILSARKYKGRR